MKNFGTRDIITLIVGIVLGFVVATYGCDEAQADTLDALAIEKVPALGHENVSIELGGYYTVGAEDLEDLTKDQGPLFSGGLAFGVAGFSVGAAVAHDRDYHVLGEKAATSGAVGITLPLGEFSALKLGAGSNIDNGSFDRLTVGAKLRFGF